MAGGLIELTIGNFETQIASGITLVDFWAPWCGPCRMQTPILENLATKLAGKAAITKVNVDDEGDLATRYGIKSIPTIILFKNGQPVKQFVGVQSEAALTSAITSA